MGFLDWLFGSKRAPGEDEPEEAFEQEEETAEAQESDEILKAEGEGFMYWQEENNRMPCGGYHGQKPPADRPALTGSEVAAWDVLTQHGFSRRLMAREGILKDYLALGVSPVTEARWRGAFLRGLMEAAGERPENLDLVAALGAEYGDETALLDAVEALDGTVTSADAPTNHWIKRCERILDAAVNGGFADHDAVLRRTREAVAELVARIETLHGATAESKALRVKLDSMIF